MALRFLKQVSQNFENKQYSRVDITFWALPNNVYDDIFTSDNQSRTSKTRFLNMKFDRLFENDNHIIKINTFIYINVELPFIRRTTLIFCEWVPLLLKAQDRRFQAMERKHKDMMLVSDISNTQYRCGCVGCYRRATACVDICGIRYIRAITRHTCVHSPLDA